MDQLGNLLNRPQDSHHRPAYRLRRVPKRRPWAHSDLLGRSCRFDSVRLDGRLSGANWDIVTLASLIGLIFAAVYAYRLGRGFPWKWALACAIALGSIGIGRFPADILAAVANDSLVTHPVLAKLGGRVWQRHDVQPHRFLYDLRKKAL
ncbi:MAG TPA: hypothetical protein VMU80_09645 [Bryobacteraceae bacterium]|nr:hypothetical protein [Bryobacteraceae bacterium]